MYIGYQANEDISVHTDGIANNNIVILCACKRFRPSNLVLFLLQQGLEKPIYKGCKSNSG